MLSLRGFAREWFINFRVQVGMLVMSIQNHSSCYENKKNENKNKIGPRPNVDFFHEPNQT